jgi:hypothetical protein
VSRKFRQVAPTLPRSFSPDDQPIRTVCKLPGKYNLALHSLSVRKVQSRSDCLDRIMLRDPACDLRDRTASRASRLVEQASD